MRKLKWETVRTLQCMAELEAWTARGLAAYAGRSVRGTHQLLWRLSTHGLVTRCGRVGMPNVVQRPPTIWALTVEGRNTLIDQLLRWEDADNKEEAVVRAHLWGGDRERGRKA